MESCSCFKNQRAKSCISCIIDKSNFIGVTIRICSLFSFFFFRKKAKGKGKDNNVEGTQLVTQAHSQPTSQPTIQPMQSQPEEKDSDLTLVSR